MSKGLQWVLGISAVLIVAAIVFSTVAPFFWPRTAEVAYGGMMGPGHMFGGRGMMDGWGGGMLGGWGGGILGLGMLGIPLLLIGLVVLGVVVLARAVNSGAARPLPPPPAPVAQAQCPHCGQPVLAGWKACPACGEKL